VTFLGEATWRGTVYPGGSKLAAGGDAAVVGPATGARFGGTANLDAFTDTRWATMRGGIAPYPS
jgi:hypothetical protein